MRLIRSLSGGLFAPVSLLACIHKLNQFFDSSVKLLSGSQACFSGQSVQGGCSGEIAAGRDPAVERDNAKADKS